jgi:ABC-type Fe3+-hydroxamate transport system substrate-binding protein
MHILVRGAVCLIVLGVAACGTRTESSITPATPGPGTTSAVTAAPKPPDQVVVTEGDITDRPYRSLGDIDVTVKKWTIFDADPTREQVAKALKEKAAAMGADAVVLVRYGTVGVGFTSWGQMDGQGRAVAFQN